MKGKFIMTINYASNTIELTQKESKAAGKYNSDAYHELLNAKKDYPKYRVVVVRSRKTSSSVMKGLTYEYMESYISMADKEGTLLEEFSFMRQVYGYAVTKKWFMNKFPEPFKFAA